MKIGRVDPEITGLQEVVKNKERKKKRKILTHAKHIARQASMPSGLKTSCYSNSRNTPTSPHFLSFNRIRQVAPMRTSI